MPERRRVLRRIAMAALAASAAMLVPATSRGPAAGAPDAQSAHTSFVLADSHRASRLDRWSAAEPTVRPTTTAAPTPRATPTMPPPAPAVRASQPATKPVARPTIAPPPPPPAATNGGWFDAVYSGRVFDLVNAERARVGLGPLAVEPRLASSASGYAKVLGSGAPFAHTGPDGSTFVTRAQAAGFPFTVQEGEVLAWGNQGWTPEGVVRAWLNSPPHREEILSSVFTRAGIGCYFTPANGVTVYCVMDLAAG